MMQNHIGLPFQSIYLAGKISKSDWRTTIVPEITGDDEPICPTNEPPMVWPCQIGAVFGMDYVGPYFRRCDHGCYHGPASHGTNANAQTNWDDIANATLATQNQQIVQRLCLGAIQQTDLVFAWIDSREVYGTLAEIGYAKAIGKTVWIAMPHSDKELWFACHMADKVVISETPLEGLRMLLGKAILDNFFDNLSSMTHQRLAASK